jgi:hypothetical protein
MIFILIIIYAIIIIIIKLLLLCDTNIFNILMKSLIK